ncbi:hypothetical protein [Actinoplanes sp. NPDC049599]|uniref:hypothetical protein n=1 Tax=Actinoplanes sp. NPDC049599 TaxID=3363903 RepID=UPI0037A38BE7
MAAAADITAAIMAGIASLGVPWWGWAALFVMVFFGLLVPGAQETEPDAADRLRGGV